MILILYKSYANVEAHTNMITVNGNRNYTEKDCLNFLYCIAYQAHCLQKIKCPKLLRYGIWGIKIPIIYKLKFITLRSTCK